MRFYRPAVLLLAMLLVCGGCATINNWYGGMFGQQQTQQVEPQAFVQHQPGNEQPLPSPPTPQPQGQSSELPVPPPPQPLPPTSIRPPETPQPGGISPVVSNAIQPGGNPPLPGGPTTGPATEPDVGLASGQYMELGGVVALVGSTPITANEILRPLGPDLRTIAREDDADHYAIKASDLIQRKLGELEVNAVSFAAAQNFLDSSDKNLADAATTNYRDQLVTQAGGSQEVAQRKAASQGDNFDDMVYRQYQTFMVELYYQRKIYPLVQIGADDMRKYYREHLDELNKVAAARGLPPISEAPQIHFELLGINPDNFGGTPAANEQLAQQKIQAAKEELAKGDSFATVYGNVNNDAGLDLRTNKTGDMGMYQKGAFAIQAIETAVWQLQPGQVSDVISYNGTYYIARLVDKQEGFVRPFENQDVQALIRMKLQSEQFRQLEEAEQRRLIEHAIIYPDEQTEPSLAAARIQAVVDMAMQSYRVWNQKK